MHITAKIGKLEKEEISKNYFNKMAKTRIALIQMSMSSDRQKNINSAIRRIKQAYKKKAKVVCLPELFLSNYFCQQEKHSNFNLAEKIPGITTDIFCSLAKELKIELIPFLLEGVAMKPEFNQSDGIHPNEKGTIIISRTLEEIIIKALNKKN